MDILLRRKGSLNVFRIFGILSIHAVILLLVSESVAQNDSAKLVANYADFLSIRDTLVNQALNDNPSLKASVQKTDASKAAVNQITFDPPQLAVEFFQSPISSFPNPFKDQMEIDYSIQQMIPFPGKLSAMSMVEQNRTKMLTMEQLSSQKEIVRLVKTSFNELYLIDRNLDINHANQSLIRNIIAIALKQYESGTGKQTEILRAQTELSKLLSDSISLIQSRRSMSAMINAYRNKPVETEISFIPEIVPPEINSVALDSLKIVAEKNRPELQSMQFNIAMQSSEHISAKKEYLPDFMVRGMYKQMIHEDDDWSLMLGVTLPVAPWSIGKYKAGVNRTRSLINQAQLEYDNMRNMVAAQIRDALANINRYSEQVELIHNTTIPQAEQTLQSAINAYRTGEEDFLMLIDIQRMLLMTRQDYHMAVMNLITSYANLERAVGKNINPQLPGGKIL